MEEEFQKRNTDCVYFLASPLTCKKGIDCEYRHSDIARLNPRDCWYWLAGSCLNPGCAFRHPPLDSRTEASSESNPSHNRTVALNKVNVPCYFFFNGTCSKGDSCYFLHGPDDGTPAWKSLKTAAAATDALTLQNRTFPGSDSGSALTETLFNSFETVSRRVVTHVIPKEDVHFSVPNTLQNASPHISVPANQEAVASRSQLLLSTEIVTHSGSAVCTDQSPGYQGDGYIEREDWLESSPGFDVLVDNGFENMNYEDDPEYLLALDRDGRELNGQYGGYDYEDPVENDPEYPHLGTSYEQEVSDSYDQLDDENEYDYIQTNPGRSRKIMLNPIFPRKRKFPPEYTINDQRTVDLRDHLQKRRAIDGRPMACFSRMRNSSHISYRNRTGSQRQSAWRTHRKSTSGVGNNGVLLFGENGTLVNGTNQQGWGRQSHPNKHMNNCDKMKRQAMQHSLLAEVSRKRVPRKKRFTKKSDMFSGPRTLAQIKEEKKKTTGSGGSSGKVVHSNRVTSEDFEAPKPLIEILKAKNKLASVIEDNNSSSWNS